MTEQAILRRDNSVILYDESVVSHIQPAMFGAGYWTDADIAPGYSGGRGATLFVAHQGDDWVVKHYYRGGLVRKLFSDGFLYTGLSRTRSVAEWHVLQQAHAAGLPVPLPVAAHVLRRGPIYAADLITRRIPDVEPFSTRLQAGPAAPEIWHAVGQCVRRFHDAGFYHADLSTHNLQIDKRDHIWLLDWDRGCRMQPGNWQRTNLERLRRSCRKISVVDAANYVDEVDWPMLLAGYTGEG